MGKEAVLPKNVRQIGDIQGSRRIYMEDYVMTYIHRKERQEEQGFLGVFLGERQETESGTLVFIRGLVEVPDENMEEQNSRFPGKQRESQAAKIDISRSEGETEGKAQEETAKEAVSEENGRGMEKRKQNSAAEDFQDTEEFSGSVEKSGEPGKKRTVLEECREFFGPSEIQGCCVIGEYPVNRMEHLAREVPQSRRFLYHLQEQEETLYWAEAEKYEQIPGYFVFYEQNKEMQEYMAETFEEEEPERDRVPDKAIKNFRAKIRKKDQVRLNGMLKLASSFLVVTVLLVGAVVVNRIEARRRGDAVLEVPENEAPVQISTEDVVIMRSGTEGSTTVNSNAGAVQSEGSTAVNSAAGAVQSEGSGTGAEGTATVNSNAGTVQSEGSGTGAEGTTAVNSNAGTVQSEGSGTGTEGTAAVNSNAGAVQSEGSGTGAEGTAAVNSTAGTADSVSDTALSAQDESAQDISDAEPAASAAFIQNESGESDAQSIQDGAEESGDENQNPAQPVVNMENSRESEAAAMAGIVTAGDGSEENGGDKTTQISENEEAQNNRTDRDEAAEGGDTQEDEAARDGNNENSAAPEESGDTSVEASARQVMASYVIREGDTLADICQTYYGGLDKLDLICDANGIEDANMITPGQKIVLP